MIYVATVRRDSKPYPMTRMLLNTKKSREEAKQTFLAYIERITRRHNVDSSTFRVTLTTLPRLQASAKATMAKRNIPLVEQFMLNTWPVGRVYYPQIDKKPRPWK